jgi:hypothetical protein
MARPAAQGRADGGDGRRCNTEATQASLAHLMWELPPTHSDAVARPGTCHPELLEGQAGRTGPAWLPTRPPCWSRSTNAWREAERGARRRR